jgi:uncharacterized protein YcfL
MKKIIPLFLILFIVSGCSQIHNQNDNCNNKINMILPNEVTAETYGVNNVDYSKINQIKLKIEISGNEYKSYGYDEFFLFDKGKELGQNQNNYYSEEIIIWEKNEIDNDGNIIGKNNFKISNVEVSYKSGNIFIITGKYNIDECNFVDK